MVAKVTAPGKKSFYVKKGEDIHNVPQFDTLALEDKKFLALNSIKGIYRGFILTSDFSDNIVVTRDSAHPPPAVFCAKWEMRNNTPVLILCQGTRIEPITSQQMEDEIRAKQQPSLREK